MFFAGFHPIPYQGGQLPGPSIRGKDRLNIRIRIGDRLVEQGVITRQQLQTALDAQKNVGEKLGQTLVRLGVLAEALFLEFFSRELRLPLVDLKSFRMEYHVVQLLPESVARRYQAIALTRGDKGVLVGMADPTDLFAYDELTRILGHAPHVALVSASQLSQSLALAYRGVERIQEQATALDEEVGRTAFNLEGMVQAEVVVDAPVVRILQSLFEDAVRLNASDIHIEPDVEVLRLRQRIDGVLHEQVVRERRIAPALVSKLKLMAGLEIAEKRLPQDGRFNITVKGHSIDVRVSTLPTQDGESVVLRLLDQSKDHADLRAVLERDIFDRFQKVIQGLHGLVLVTGPTGSGKTTTLYGALHMLNVPDKKIITVEDPVEYRLPRINQVQVHARIGLTFSTVLRTVLRQDPDVVLVGEMRDRETAEMAIRAAMTGHLVFSSLHTNSAIGASVRLLEMGVEGYVVAAALQCIVAQRLVRRVCQGCVERMPPCADEVALLQGIVGSRVQGVLLARGRGCAVCHFTGFSGRMAVVEMLSLCGDMADALRRNDIAGLARAARMQKGYIPLHRVALEYAFQGMTTLEEALQIMTGLENEVYATSSP